MKNKPVFFSAFTFLLLAVIILSNPRAVACQDQPTIAKDSVQVTAFTVNSFGGNYDIWSWVPRIKFRVNGPIASGSRLYVEFAQPDGKPWLKFDCDTDETQKGYWWQTNAADVKSKTKASQPSAPLILPSSCETNWQVQIRRSLPARRKWKRLLPTRSDRKPPKSLSIS